MATSGSINNVEDDSASDGQQNFDSFSTPDIGTIEETCSLSDLDDYTSCSPGPGDVDWRSVALDREAELEQCYAELMLAKRSTQEVTEENDELVNDMQCLVNENDNLVEELREHKRIKEAVFLELESVKKDRTDLTESLERAHDTIASLNDANELVTQMRLAMNRKIFDAETEKLALVESFEALRSEFDVLQEDMTALSETKQKLTKELVLLRRQARRCEHCEANPNLKGSLLYSVPDLTNLGNRLPSMGRSQTGGNSSFLVSAGSAESLRQRATRGRNSMDATETGSKNAEWSPMLSNSGSGRRSVLSSLLQPNSLIPEFEEVNRSRNSKARLDSLLECANESGRFSRRSSVEVPPSSAIPKLRYENPAGHTESSVDLSEQDFNDSMFLPHSWIQNVSDSSETGTDPVEMTASEEEILSSGEQASDGRQQQLGPGSSNGASSPVPLSGGKLNAAGSEKHASSGRKDMSSSSSWKDIESRLNEVASEDSDDDASCELNDVVNDIERAKCDDMKSASPLPPSLEECSFNTSSTGESTSPKTPKRKNRKGLFSFGGRNNKAIEKKKAEDLAAFVELNRSYSGTKAALSTHKMLFKKGRVHGGHGHPPKPEWYH